MWPDLEETVRSPEPATWGHAIQAALSGLAICALILVAFAAVGSPAPF